MDNVPSAYKISDERPKSRFLKHTFGGYKRNQVLSHWKKSLDNGVLDKAIYWTVELDISCMTNTLWTKMIKYFSQNVGVKNPKLPYFMWKRYNAYIESKKRCDDIMLFRNNQESRNHLCECVSVLTLSDKHKLPQLPKIVMGDFSEKRVKQKMKCNHLGYIRDIVKIDDPRDYMVPINEIYHYLSLGDHSSDTKDNCLYWLSWLYEYGKQFEKHKNCKCISRLVVGVDDKYTTDVIWIIWEVIFDCIKKMPKTQIQNEMYRQVTSLFYFYKCNYKHSNKNSRKCYVIQAILLCIDTIPSINYEINIYHSYSTIVSYCMKINNIYIKIAKPRKVQQVFSEPLKKKKKSPKITSMFKS